MNFYQYVLKGQPLSNYMLYGGLKDLGLIKVKDMLMRGSNTQKILLGSVWTGLCERGSPLQQKTLQTLTVRGSPSSRGRNQVNSW